MAGLYRAFRRRNRNVSNYGAPVMCLDAGSLTSYSGSGTTWTDLSTNATNATLVNSPTYNSNNFGYLTFNGSTTYADTTVKLFTTQQFTVTFWINVTTFNGTVCSGAVSNSSYSIFGATSNYQGFTNTFSACVQTGASANSVGTVNQSNYSTGVWYHYCAVYDGTQASNATKLLLYINAVSKTLTYDAAVPTTPYNNLSNTRVGYGVGGSYPYLNGSISSVMYYTRAWTATEVSTYYEMTRGRYAGATTTTAAPTSTTTAAPTSTTTSAPTSTTTTAPTSSTTSAPSSTTTTSPSTTVTTTVAAGAG